MTAEELQEWRKSQELTQLEASRLLGTTKTSVYRWEHGHHDIPQTIAILVYLLGDKKNIRCVERFV